MLKDNNDEQLRQKRVNEKTIPFYQIWLELVNEKTLDIYQYRILKKTLAGVFINEANIESCREETLYILNNDMIMEKHYKGVSNRLRYSLGSKPKTEAEKTRLLAQVQYVINEIAPTYERNAIDELKSAILNGEINVITFLSNIVASQAAHKGWSSQALNDLLRFFRDDKGFDEQWNTFEATILNNEMKLHNVLIHIPFRNQRNGEDADTLGVLNNLGLDVCTYAQLIQEFNDIADITSLLNAEKRYFRVQVEAHDVYSAAHKAIRKISDLLNMASFYNIVSAWDLSSVSIVAINSINGYHKAFNAEQLYKTYDYLDSSSRVFDYTKQIFTDDGKISLREKLTGAFGYANISRASLFQEEKYMNLWVALESLARTKMYPDIISNVKQTVPAAMSLRYIYRIVRNYVEDCMRCRVLFDFPGRSIDMKQDTKQKMVQETIEVFRDQTLYNVLLQKCEVNALLKYRTELVHEILNDVKVLKNKIKNHHDRVEWQTQRLYRIRNEIVHSALQNETSLIMYIEHLYDYLSTYITEIVTCMSEGKEGTLEETLAIIKDNYDVFISFAEQGENGLIEENVMKTGIISLI